MSGDRNNPSQNIGHSQFHSHTASVLHSCSEETPAKNEIQEKFVTTFNRRIYQALTDRIKANEDHSVTSFNGEFSPDEVGKITSILEKYRNMGISKDVVYEYIDLLSNYTEKTPQKGDMSDDEFLNFANKLKSKKS